MTGIIAVDWRTDTTEPSALLARMQGLLTQIDHTGMSTIEVANSRARKACQIESENGVAMWTRRRVAVGKPVANHRDYIAKFVVVGMHVIEMISFKEPRKLRKLFYLLGSKQLSHQAIKSILYDWALTLNVHPWTLGITTQETGHVTVPPGLIMTCFIVNNVFGRSAEKKGLRGDESTIPSRIRSINLKFKSGFKLRAVAVFEHRNLDFSSDNAKAYVPDVLIIQVRISYCYLFDRFSTAVKS